MSRHRFQHLTNRFSYLNDQPVAFAVSRQPEASSSLVPCPACFLQNVAPAQQQWIEAVYREAYERARENLRPAWLRNDRFWVFN
jgi:hypothetical protein